MLRFRDLAIILIATLAAAFFLKAFVLDAVVIPSGSMQNTLLPGDFVLVNKMSYGNMGIRSSHSPAIIPFLSRLTERHVRSGDVIVFKFPATIKNTIVKENDLFVKRCIAKGGDVVEIEHNKILVNELRVEMIESENHSDSYEPTDEFYPNNSNNSFEHYGPIRVPKQGDILDLTKETYSKWESLIREEGHTVSINNRNQITIDGSPQNHYIVQKNYLFVMGDNYYHSFDSRFWGFLPEDHVIGQASFVYWSLNNRTNGNSIKDIFNSIRWARIGTFIR